MVFILCSKYLKYAHDTDFIMLLCEINKPLDTRQVFTIFFIFLFIYLFFCENKGNFASTAVVQIRIPNLAMG